MKNGCNQNLILFDSVMYTVWKFLQETYTGFPVSDWKLQGII